MKRIIMACALLMTASGAAAQNCYMARTGVFEADGKVVIENPMTTLAVDLRVEQEIVLCGPYARYAQKFLGVRAPLTDKTTFTLAGASVALAEDTGECMAAPKVAPSVLSMPSHSRSDVEFARIQPDKTSLTTLPLEDAAREAANTIFSLRRHRMDLITGEAGENVFGGGLAAALQEIEHLEQSYLELFLGKRVVENKTVRYLLSPAESKRQYIVCRFSADLGLVPETDLSGEIVLLQINPSGETAFPYEALRRETNVVDYRIADPSECVVAVGSTILTKSRLPIFEFGRTVKVAIPRKK